MSADTAAAAAAAANRDGGGSGSGIGNGGSGDAGAGDGAGRHSGDQGTALSKIDDPDAFHLKTVRESVGFSTGGGVEGGRGAGGGGGGGTDYLETVPYLVLTCGGGV